MIAYAYFVTTGYVENNVLVQLAKLKVAEFVEHEVNWKTTVLLQSFTFGMVLI